MSVSEVSFCPLELSAAGQSLSVTVFTMWLRVPMLLDESITKPGKNKQERKSVSDQSPKRMNTHSDAHEFAL